MLIFLGIALYIVIAVVLTGLSKYLCTRYIGFAVYEPPPGAFIAWPFFVPLICFMYLYITFSDKIDKMARKHREEDYKKYLKSLQKEEKNG